MMPLPLFDDPPFRGRSPQARHASRTGSRVGRQKAPSQAVRILAALAEGPLTRQQISERVGVPVHLLCARIFDLKKAGQVREVDLVMGQFGARNVRYGLAL